MAKNKERRTAKTMFLKGKSQKEIALAVKVQEKTIGNWVKKYGWLNERDARFNSTKNRIENIKAIISTLSENRLEVDKALQHAKKEFVETSEDTCKEAIERLQKEAAVISDEVSKWNKTLENLDKENRISLATKITVMEDIFQDLQNYDSKLFMKMLDFQEQYLTKIASNY